MTKTIIVVKFITILAFMATLSATYYLRSEVLKLNTIRFSAENVKSEEAMRRMIESQPMRVAEYEVLTKNYELQIEHYQQMLKLYRTDYDQYVKRIKDEYAPPMLPNKPFPPSSPEVGDKIATINAQFRQQQFHYFDSSSRLNWACCVSALILVGGLLFLMMFENGIQRFAYLAVLLISFVFMIGPSFHSIISAIVGLLEAPIY